MKATTSQQNSCADLEFEDLRLDHETTSYRVEIGRLADMQCRIISPQVNPLNPSIESWLALRQKTTHSGLPHSQPRWSNPQGSVQQLVETWHGALDLHTYLDERNELLTELSAVYLTLQAATVIEYLLRIGEPVSNLDERNFVVDERLEGLPKLTYTGWLPEDDSAVPPRNPDPLRLIARILYRCLTGSLPPSDEVPDSLSDDSSSNLGFDNLLMNWVTEERELGALGACALEALHGAESHQSIIDFIREVYPHLQRSTHQAITEATHQLLSERRLLQSVDKHRAKLKELRTRHQYLSGWLMDHEPELDEASRSLARTHAYAHIFKEYAQSVRKKLKEGMGRSSAETSPAEVLDLTIASMPHKKAPLSFTELATDIEEELPFPLSESSVQSNHEQSAPNRNDGDSIATLTSTEPQHTAEEGRQPSPLSVCVLVGLSATVLGVLVAWGLLSSSAHTEPSDDTVIFQKESK